MTEPYQEDKPAAITPMNGAQLVQVILLGAAVGLIIWGLTQLLDMYVFKAILCQGNGAPRCASGPTYAEAAASIIGAGVGLYFMVKQQTFRPLLIVVAALVGLWGLVQIIDAMTWYAGAIVCVGLYAFAYAAFAWVARIRLFWIVILLMLVLVVGVRLTLMS